MSSSPAILAATGVVSLAIGFGAATLLMPPRPLSQPIVDANAWNEVSPAAMAIDPVRHTSLQNSVRCDPYEVSDVAMEAMLDEMLRRGWRAPNQGDAVARIDAAQTTGLQAVDPDAPMIPRGGWPRAVIEEEIIETLPVDTDGGVEVTVDEPATPPAPLPSPPPS
jgi:hypothetical protein